MSAAVPPLSSKPLLRFACGGCGQELEAPVACAGLVAPCPVCGNAVFAPRHQEHYPAPTPARTPAPDSGYFIALPEDFWEAALLGAAHPVASTPPEPGATGQLSTADGLSAMAHGWAALPKAVLPPPRAQAPGGEGESGMEAFAQEKVARRRWGSRYFDAALLLLLGGTLAVGGMAIFFTQSKHSAAPSNPQELSTRVLEKMQHMDQRRDEAAGAARGVLEKWVASSGGLGQELCLQGDPLPSQPPRADAGEVISGFEFIQARRIPGTERFLTLFELPGAPPLVIPVEETTNGARVHGRALLQQQQGLLAKFLQSQGQGEEVFYVLLKPAPVPMAGELLRARPDLGKFLLAAVEPAFPADGPSGCLVCIAPETDTAAVFAKRAHDSSLRQAVVRLAWRQHRESGNFVQLAAFEPNAWSRH